MVSLRTQTLRAMRWEYIPEYHGSLFWSDWGQVPNSSRKHMENFNDIQETELFTLMNMLFLSFSVNLLLPIITYVFVWSESFPRPPSSAPHVSNGSLCHSPRPLRATNATLE